MCVPILVMLYKYARKILLLTFLNPLSMFDRRYYIYSIDRQISQVNPLTGSFKLQHCNEYIFEISSLSIL